MFEGKPPTLPSDRARDSGEPAVDELCPLDWSDLKAKLAAMRDRQREIERPEIGSDASFDAHCARRIAAHQDRFEDGGEPDVNPDDLANGKGPGPLHGGRVAGDDPANRGST